MSKQTDKHFFGYGIILFASVLFASYGVWSRLMGDTFPPFYQAWVRSLIIMAIMMPPMLYTKSFRKIERRDWPKVSFFVVFCICTQVPLYYAFNHAAIGAVQLIFYSVFIITAYVVGRLYLGEVITKTKMAAMLLAIAGLVVVFGQSVITFAPFGLTLAAFNGVASGGETASTKKISDKYPPALLVFWGWVFTFLTHMPISLIIGERQVPVHFDRAWMWLLVYAVVNALAFWISIEGWRHVDASIASLVGLTEVLFAIVFGAIFFHEKLRWSIYVGAVMIIFAAMLPDLQNIIKGKQVNEPLDAAREI